MVYRIAVKTSILIKLVEQKLGEKIDISEAKITGKVDTLTAKTDS